jgi:cytochrome oxidase Cu insertion factor (SCO1/SenC/PrrC family)
MKDFKVYARKVLIPENLSNYNVDHTSLVYIMNERNEFVDVVNPSLSER